MGCIGMTGILADVFFFLSSASGQPTTAESELRKLFSTVHIY